MEDELAYIDAHRERFVRDLIEWVKVPSISGEPAHAGDVAASAQHLAAALRARGATAVQYLPTPGHPAVYGEWMHAPGKPVLLVYGHHDVQPVDPLDQWLSPPFVPEIRDGRLYGRGVVDDKGQVYIHVMAVEAFLASRASGRGGGLPINLKLLVEGEEEIGSAHLGSILSAHADLLRADYVCVSDTAMYGRGIPSLCVGLRGLSYFDVRVTSQAFDLHSGSFGGAIRNPASVLAQIIAHLHDDDGRVAIPGFYDRVRELSAPEREQIAQLPHDDAAWGKMAGARALFGERGYTTLERLWIRPTLDVCGLTSGFQGEGSKTIVPATATAKVSCRLVPDQTPDEIARLFIAYVRQIAPASVDVEVTVLPGALPYAAPTDHPVFEVARRAMSKAFDGKPTVLIREGGSIPFVRTIADATGKPCLLIGFGQPDENSHAPNEWLDLENFHRGIKSAAYLYDEIARLDG